MATARVLSTSEETVQATPKQIAERFGLLKIDATKGYVHATALLRFLEVMGVAKKIRREPGTNGRGKGAHVWEIPMSIQLDMTGEFKV